MPNPIPITTAITGILAIAQVPLTFLVSYLRGKTGIQFLDGGNETLLRRIRAHGNFSVYVPFALLLMLSAEVNGSPVWFVALVAAMLVSGRLLHAAAIPAGNIPKRVKAMKLTFGALVFGAVANLIPLVGAVLG